MQLVSASKWQRVCTLDDLVPEAGVCALVNGAQVAIFYLPDEPRRLYAIGKRDPIGLRPRLIRTPIARAPRWRAGDPVRAVVPDRPRRP